MKKRKKNPQTNSNDLFVANRGERRSEMQIHNVRDRAGCQYYGAERESATQMGGKKQQQNVVFQAREFIFRVSC